MKLFQLLNIAGITFNHSMKHKLYLMLSIVLLLQPVLFCLLLLQPLTSSPAFGFLNIITLLDALIFSVLPALYMCDLFLNFASDSTFVYCSDIPYLKLPSVILIYVLPSIYFFAKYHQTKPFVSKWKKYR